MVEHRPVAVRQSAQQGRYLEASRDLKAGHLMCQETRQACFCTPVCAKAAESTVGGPNMALRKVLAAVPWAKLTLDECNQARFMLHVLSLRQDSSCSEEAGTKWAQFCSLHALPPDSSSHEKVWEVIQALVDPGVSHDDVSLCLRKEAANAFGIMAPSGKDGERKIRGTGVYELTSMINHSCMPTAARVDDPDCEGPMNTHMHVKVIQDVPAGEEVSISYFPMHLELQQRQERCRDLYGFTCVCMRCKSDMAREQSAASEAYAAHVACDSSMESSSISPGQREQTALEAQYIELYLMKYICTEPDCFGTFVPQDHNQKEENRGSSMKCNVCENVRTEEEFMSAVQKLLSESSD